MNYRRTRATNQAFYSARPIISDCVTKDPVAFFTNECTPTQRKIFGRMLAIANCCPELYFTQSYIAKKIGCVRETVNRLLRPFEELGLISSNFRYKTSNQYQISPYFEDLNVRRILKPIFKCLYWLPLSILLSREVRSVQECHTSNLYIYISQLNSKLAYNINCRIVSLAMSRIREAELADERDRLRRGIVKKKVVQSLNVTPLGAAKLLAFSSKAHEYAIGEFAQCTQLPDNIFATYVGLCLNYSNNHNLIPDWTLAYREMRKLGYASGMQKEWEYLNKDEPVFYKEIEVETQSANKAVNSDQARERRSSSHDKRPSRGQSKYSKKGYDNAVEPPQYQSWDGHKQPDTDKIAQFRANRAAEALQSKYMLKVLSPSEVDMLVRKVASPITLSSPTRDAYGNRTETDAEILAKLKQHRDVADSTNPYLDVVIKAFEDGATAKQAMGIMMGAVQNGTKFDRR